jgi:methyl-accepting chemotaxis protein
MQAMLAAELTSHRSMVAAVSSEAGGAAGGGDGELRQMLAECGHLDRQLDHLFSEVNGVLLVTTNLDGKAAFLLTLSSSIHLVALNAVIASCRVEGRGAGFAVVTQHLAAVSQESTVTIDTMTRELRILTASLRETAFSITTAKLQVEMTVFFLRELIAASQLAEQGTAARPDIRSEIEMLVASFSASAIQLAAAVPRVRQAIPGLLGLQHELGGDLRRLAIVRLLGKIHATGLAEEGHCRELLDEILEHSRQASAELEVMSAGVGGLQQQLPTLERSASTVNRTVQGLPAARAHAGALA